jgi:nucleoside-diphosphate-sugar epimerase
MSPNTELRVVVTGATGNVGTSVVRALADHPQVGSVLGLARRIPELSVPKTEWATVNLARLEDTHLLWQHFAGADAVIHLAWRFQPTHDPVVTWETNVLGSLEVFNAVASAGVPVLIHASSVGAYSPGPKEGRTPRTAAKRPTSNEFWTPTSGTIPRSASCGCGPASCSRKARRANSAASSQAVSCPDRCCDPNYCRTYRT